MSTDNIAIIQKAIDRLTATLVRQENAVLTTRAMIDLNKAYLEKTVKTPTK